MEDILNTTTVFFLLVDSWTCSTGLISPLSLAALPRNATDEANHPDRQAKSRKGGSRVGGKYEFNHERHESGKQKKKQKKTINKRRREILGRKSYCEYLKRSKDITILGGYLLLIT